jgi:hypothetical protein
MTSLSITLASRCRANSMVNVRDIEGGKVTGSRAGDDAS